ncbi:hypothetical protein Lal_00029278 [Lupinus albus]|uniref:Putative pectinesterase n=1 Tax=Lupinus albus TaxID=3870 RepID=A0A6A4NM83_LUPAL|nr:putative pectinesterase [Lupinus albus]KAF1885389.1 hypothetical protein Lal_00029278 [Lupinus albus]
MALHTLVKDSMSCLNIFIIISFLIFISTLPHTSSASTSTNVLNSYKKFIKVKCNSTTYSNVCYKSLSPYASKIKTNTFTLTKTSVYLALNATKTAYVTLNKLSKSKGNLTHAETEVIADCKYNIRDAVDLLQQSADGLEDLNDITTDEERYRWDDIKTWMSASITDESTCTDESDEMEVQPSLQKKIKRIVANVAQKNSIALALVNNLSY